MPAITAGPEPFSPWLPNEFTTVSGTSAKACRPSRYAPPVDSIWSGRSMW